MTLDGSTPNINKMILRTSFINVKFIVLRPVFIKKVFFLNLILLILYLNNIPLSADNFSLNRDTLAEMLVPKDSNFAFLLIDSSMQTK